MALFKMTMYFTGTPGVGWSESWYLSATNISNAQANAQAIHTQRVAFLDVFYTQAFTRIAAIFPTGQSILIPGGGPGTWINRTVAGSVQGDPNFGILVNFLSGLGHRRSMIFRGMPPGIFINQNWYVDPGSGVFTTGLNQLLTALNANGAGLLYNSTPALKPITALAPDPLNSGMAQVTSPAHGLATGQVITLYKLRARPSLAGKKKIIVTAVNTFLLQGTDLGVIFYQGNGQYRVFTPLTDGALTFSIRRAATHKTGRPFALLRGRSLRRL